MTPSMQMNKPDLIKEAVNRGLEIDEQWTKEQILDAIEDHDIASNVNPAVKEPSQTKQGSIQDHKKFDKFKSKGRE